MQSKSGRVVVLATGGTLAGTSAAAGDDVGYRAGQIGVAQLLAAVPGLNAFDLEARQLAQIDSKDMDHALWQRLAQRVQAELDRPEVAGLVITHGTDTLEETAWFLHRVLAPRKPVVLTAAMRPATALMADGPQNLLDAVLLASGAAGGEPSGVLAMLAGQVHGAEDVRKLHGYRIDAFSSGDAGPLAVMEEGRLRPFRAWPSAAALGLARIAAPATDWPRVGVVCSHAGCDGALVDALCAMGYQGLVIEGTGNGTVHESLETAVQRVLGQHPRLQVLRATRCQLGGVVGAPAGALPSAGGLSPAKARIELMLRLMA
ncbi:asparaginase [Ideonella sp.]|uniref:asparaginase n=1 Tax=Ideonella sp. TaxID=1929293 RepID=UPI003BB7BDE0